MISKVNLIWMVGDPVNSLSRGPGPHQPNVSRLNDIPRKIRPNALSWNCYAVLAGSVKAGCLLTAAIREEQSSYRENSVASAHRGKVKRRGSGDCSWTQNEQRRNLSSSFPMNKAEYQAYLESDHWQEFRSKIRQERSQCEGCGIDNKTSLRKYRQNLNVHHKNYERIGQEKPSDVELLCWKCHLTHHGAGGFVDFVQSFSMPEVKKFPVSCSHCGKEIGSVWNFDETSIERLCRDCREGAISYDY
jgi:hypothetical protein